MDGEEYTLPANPFTAASGYQFKGWATSPNGNILEDEKIIVSENVTLYAIWELNKPADPNSPATGDNSSMALWIALLFISGGAVITSTVVDRKRRTASKR